MALPAISRRSASAAVDLARWRRSAWIRGSNGASEPLAASVESAPVTSAALQQRCGMRTGPSQRIGGRELGAVEQRQSFLRAKRQRRQAGLRQGAAAGLRPAANRSRRRRSSSPPCARAAPDRPSADRALARDDRRQAPGQHRFEQRPSWPAARPRPLRQARRASAPASGERPGRRRIAHARRVRLSTILRWSVARSARRCGRWRACRSPC